MLQKSTINPRFVEWNILCGVEIRTVGSGADFREDVQPKKQIICPSPTCNSREGTQNQKTQKSHWCRTIFKSSPQNVGSSSNSSQGLRIIHCGSFLCPVGIFIKIDKYLTLAYDIISLMNRWCYKCYFPCTFKFPNADHDFTFECYDRGIINTNYWSPICCMLAQSTCQILQKYYIQQSCEIATLFLIISKESFVLYTSLLVILVTFFIYMIKN